MIELLCLICVAVFGIFIVCLPVIFGILIIYLLCDPLFWVIMFGVFIFWLFSRAMRDLERSPNRN